MREQEHYFFRLSSFAPFLEEHLEGLQGTVNARNYAQGWVREGLRDWCITRTLDWGVRYPGRDDLVVYVWVDAPIGYISFTEEWAAEHGTDWKRYWCGSGEITHFIGGDITYHHCIFWPALLKGAGFGLPTAVVASGMLKVDDHKFSKSRGYVVWTNEDYLDLGLPADCLRYYLLAYTSHTKELNFSWRAFADRVNNELVNTFGNFVHRTLHFAHTRLGGIPACPPREEVLNEIRQTLTAVDEAMEAYEFKTAVDAVLALAASGNTLIQSNAPWKLIKTDADAAAQVIADALQVVRALAVLIEPVMPETGRAIWSMLGAPGAIADERLASCTTPLTPGPLVMPTPLFSKIEDKQVAELDALLAARVAEAESRSCKPSLEEPPLSIDEFSRMELVVGRVLSAEPIKKSKKLLRLVVDIGAEERQIVSGIAQFYSPEELVGTDVVVIANLAPAVLFGVESRGMILAAGDEASLLVPQRSVAPGTRVR
ncbi:Methionine--tRNA ligase [anaerobic digester metagenome]